MRQFLEKSTPQVHRLEQTVTSSGSNEPIEALSNGTVRSKPLARRDHSRVLLTLAFTNANDAHADGDAFEAFIRTVALRFCK